MLRRDDECPRQLDGTGRPLEVTGDRDRLRPDGWSHIDLWSEVREEGLRVVNLAGPRPDRTRLTVRNDSRSPSVRRWS